MEGRKVILTHLISVGLDREVNDQINGAHFTRMIEREDVDAVIILSNNIELTVGQVHTMERSLRAIWKVPVSVIY